MSDPVPSWVRGYAEPSPSFLRRQRPRRRWRAVERGAQVIAGAGYLVIGMLVLGVAVAVWGVSVALRDFWRDR